MNSVSRRRSVVAGASTGAPRVLLRGCAVERSFAVGSRHRLRPSRRSREASSALSAALAARRRHRGDQRFKRAAPHVPLGARQMRRRPKSSTASCGTRRIAPTRFSAQKQQRLRAARSASRRRRAGGGRHQGAGALRRCADERRRRQQQAQAGRARRPIADFMAISRASVAQNNAATSAIARSARSRRRPEVPRQGRSSCSRTKPISRCG